MLTLCLAALAAAYGPQASSREGDEETASEEIIVTGERVRRTLQETASSVAVMTEADIEAQPVDRIEQLLAAVPNVQLGSGSDGPNIRGLDTTGALQALPAFLGGNRPRTTIVIDGRPTTYNEFVFGVEPAWDVNRVEVFRSPQTTTQGQNSIAGAIFVFTNDPTHEPEYRARGILGDYKTRQLSVLASGPVAGDNVAFRVAGDLRYSRTTSRIIDRAEGADPSHDVYGLLRAKLLVTPSGLPDTRMVLSYSHLESQAPQLVGVSAPFEKRRDDSGFYGTFRINVDSLTSTLRHRAGDITANLLLTVGDSLARRLAFPGAGQTRIAGRDWSAEAVANWSPERALQLIGGVSHRHLALDQIIDLSILSGIGQFHDRQDGTGVFGEASLPVTSRTTVTAGLRYQHDRQRRIGSLETGPGTSIDLDFDGQFHAWLPKLSIAHDFTPSLRAGVLVQRAYNPGGTTVRFDTGAPDNFGAESLWDYEVFARAVLVGGRLTANANLFYYHMKNAQRAEDIIVRGPSGFPVGFANLFNVPTARSYGLEASLDWRPASRFSAALAVGLLDAKIIRTEGENSQFEGKDFQRSPHFSASASADWWPIDNLRVWAQMRHHSPYFSDDLNTPLLRIASATIVDVRAQYDFGRLAGFAYVRNVLDTLKPRWLLFETFGVLEDPRQIGIGVEARF